VSAFYLEHAEILDEINRRRDARWRRYEFGQQALAFGSVPRLVRTAVDWLKEIWTLRECADRQHPRLRQIHKEVVDRGNGTEDVIRIIRCDQCGEIFQTRRIRPAAMRRETNRPDALTSGPPALRR
jgi:hypothetical protein